MFGKIGKGLKKINPFKDKDKSDGRTKSTVDDPLVKLSKADENQLMKSTRVVAKQRKNATAGDDWAGF